MNVFHTTATVERPREGCERPQDRGLALPPGTWVKCHGIRRFVPADPTWHPVEGVDLEAESVFMRLSLQPSPINAPPIRPYRHVCECGCLLFGIENCPNCLWIALRAKQEREAA